MAVIGHPDRYPERLALGESGHARGYPRGIIWSVVPLYRGEKATRAEGFSASIAECRIVGVSGHQRAGVAGVSRKLASRLPELETRPRRRVPPPQYESQR